MDNFSKLRNKLNSFVIFRNLLETPLFRRFSELLEAFSKDLDESEKVGAYCGFIRELYAHSENFTDYVLKLVLEDENPYVIKRGAGEKIGELETECLANELALLEETAKIPSEAFTEIINYDGFLPRYLTSEIDFSQVYAERLLNISKIGFGVYSTHHVFVMGENGLSPVDFPDTVRLSSLSGYENEHNQVIENTLALLEGKPANNCLLYGDCGTGKSSTVKAVANEFRDRGLRLIEIKKKQLHLIPDIIEEIGRNPLKFILFIDDLSFSEDDDDYAALKAALEGSVSSSSPNMVIYATSNRRHLVKESFSSREGDDVHFGDTVQELMSLSERFGLTITFMRPDKKLYLQVVEDLAKQYDVKMPIDEVLKKAEAYALTRSGRSPRCAKQFIEYLKGTEK